MLTIFFNEVPNCSQSKIIIICAIVGGILISITIYLLLSIRGKLNSIPIPAAHALTSLPPTNGWSAAPAVLSASTVALQSIGSSVQQAHHTSRGFFPGAQVDARGVNMSDIGGDQHIHSTGNTINYVFNLPDTTGSAYSIPIQGLGDGDINSVPPVPPPGGSMTC